MFRFAPFALALTACTAPAPDPASAPAPIVVSLGEIETDAEGRCFARTAPPTRTDIVEEMIEVAPAQRGPDGAVVNPAVFRTVSRPQTVATGEGRRFETVCPPLYTEAFVSTLQRALLIRRAYAGPISGQYDETTRLAVEQFQRDRGTDSRLLAVQTARDLGILEIRRQ